VWSVGRRKKRLVQGNNNLSAGFNSLLCRSNRSSESNDDQTTTLLLHVQHLRQKYAADEVERVSENWASQVTRSSAHAEMARHARRWTHAAEVQISTFLRHASLVFRGRIRDHGILLYGSAAACR